MAKVLIPDYPGKQVLAGIRSLSRAGDICDNAWDAQTKYKLFRSKEIASWFKISPSDMDAKAYVEDVAKLCQKNHYDLIIPFGLTSYYAASRYAEMLNASTKMMVPPFGKFQLANDKAKMNEYCQSIGLDIPTAYADYQENDFPQIAKDIQYPVVIKARGGNGVAATLRYANNAQELRQSYYEITEQNAKVAFDFAQPLIQEFIPGFIHDACTLTQNGEVITVLTQKRQVMFPISGGVGAINITTHEPRLTEIVKHLLKSLQWHGPAQIEFKLDPRDGKYKFIEMNPKLWGTLDLSIKAGVNFPAMIRDICLDKAVKRNQSYPADIRYKFLFPLAVSAYMQLAHHFGVSSIFTKARHTKTYYDFDLKDFGPDLRRLLATRANLGAGTVKHNLSNLPLDFVTYQ